MIEQQIEMRLVQTAVARTTRIERLKRQFNRAAPSLCVERALAFTRSHRQTEGLPLIVRRAKAFRAACEQIPVTIFDDELIVGTPGATQRPGPVCPEISWKWLDEELDTVSSRSRDPYRVTEEQKRVLREEVFPYWQGKSLEEIVLARLPEETRRLGVDSGILDSEIKWRSGVAEIAPEFQDLLFEIGFKGVREQAEARLAGLEALNPEALSKIHFYTAIVEVCDGIVALGRRYAAKARAMAAVETDEPRRRELSAVAEICDRVPEYPPRTFREAIQMVWFVQIGCVLSENGPAFNPGRFDQYMYPYYRDDVAAGRLTPEDAQELIDCLWIKLSEWLWLLPENGAKYYGGYNAFQNVTIGGKKRDGSDAVNDLSYMCLVAIDHVRMTQPALSIRVHPETPEAFLRAACRLARLGTGFPAFHNDRIGAQMMMYAGLPPEEARDWSLLGCVVPHQRKIGEWTDAGAYNMAAALEWALNDGRSRLTGERSERLGLPTGDPRGFETFDALKNAFFSQLRYMIKHAAITTTVEEDCHWDNMPRPFVSALVDGCLEKGMDITHGGARFNVGPGWVAVGAADCANSLAAVKKLVYDDRAISMDELCRALDADFEGHEASHQMMLRCPKYGNDDDEVDRFAVEVTEFVDRELRGHRSRLGLPFHNAMMGLTNNMPTGNVVGALPSGRKARVPLGEGCSPHPGTDVSGPTACMRSVSKINHENHPGGTLLNIKFTPSVLAGEKGITDLVTLIRGYFDIGGYHCQFNVISPETLRDAQAHPEKYEDLLVRVAGYSARFVILSRDVQEEIIRRTTHQTI